MPFEIPELPGGRVLEFRLISNWGDPTHIGLNSIEIFLESGERANIKEIFSNATDISGHIESLLTESRICKDVEKMWTANMISHNEKNESNKQPIMVTMEMEDVSKIAMIRFWNYNASRVRAQIGVRRLEMYLDNNLIFQGDIDCAFSSDSEFEPQMGDTILFTTDDQILEKIAGNDICLVPQEIFHNSNSLSTLNIASATKLLELTPFRPTTCESKEIQTPIDAPIVQPFFPKEKQVDENDKKDVKVIHIELVTNWGMCGLIGLTGIEIVDKNNQIIDESQISATVSVGDDQETVRRLFNGRNLTRNQEDMWLVEYSEKQKVTISMNFQKSISLRAISIWNYNGSFEMSYAGAKVAHIFVNGKLVMSNVLLRKSTGFVYFDFVQDILIDNVFGRNPSPVRPLTNTIGGFVFQVRLLSTWGDEFYIGLNGIELYNRKGELMKIREHNLAAFPESVNILPQIKNDLRTSDNLINGINDTEEARNMWLTAVLPNSCARVFFVFDVPTYISKMVLYNYRKTPERGVRHVSISIDDLIVFSGEVPSSTMDVTAKLEINLQESS